MGVIDKETREAWRKDAGAHADATRHESGYYPSARLVGLLDALDEAEDRAQRFAQRIANIAQEQDDARVALARVRALADEWEADGKRVGYDSREQHENDLLASTVVPALHRALDGTP